MDDQELLDRFAMALSRTEQYYGDSDDDWADSVWQKAIALKRARDRIFTTAKPAQPDPGPFPTIETEET